MIFQFPDIETFRLAVTSAQVPVEVSGTPAEVAFDGAGNPSVRPLVGMPSKPMLNVLKKLGVKQAKEHYSEATLTVACWPQVLPVTKCAAAPEVTANTPVVFEIPVADMSVMVTEMLRLGNDRQSFRTIAAADGSDDRVLLKVIGPPYYTLLRAIDKSLQNGTAVTAYVEKAPRVWVELGYAHPMETQIKPAEAQALLLRAERNWFVIEDGPFQDVYEILDFTLPAESVEWQEARIKDRISITPRLAPGNAADIAELWVLTEDAIDQVDAFVRDADERLVSRLLFAAVERDGRVAIVIKTRPSKVTAPALTFIKADAFKPYWKMPNLFIPVGKRLMPTLRRDRIRSGYAEDPSFIYWLSPEMNGKCSVCLPDSEFRPLGDWVDYIIKKSEEILHRWSTSTLFDFDSFICRDDQADKPAPPADRLKKAHKGGRDKSSDALDLSPMPSKGEKKKSKVSAPEMQQIAGDIVPPSELKIQLHEAEEQFKNVDGPLDDPARVALWPELARLNAGLKDKSEAAICWANAFWHVSEVPDESISDWLRSEDPDARAVATAEEWDTALSIKMPSPEAVRGVAARVIHACQHDPVPESFRNRLSKIRDYLEKHENLLGVRTVWLAWWHLAGVGGPSEDPKAVAHVRDRLLQRLLAEGLNKERDLPYFLRMAGEGQSERTREMRDRAKRLHQLIVRWHERDEIKVNEPFVDLMFAFGFAKLGEVTAARDLVQSATNHLRIAGKQAGLNGKVHDFLLKAFLYRIENAIQSKPHSGPLATELMAGLPSIDDGRGKDGVTARYVIDRLRNISWILEPVERLDPYAENKRSGGGLYRTIADLSNIREPIRLADEIRRLLRGSPPPHERLAILVHSLNSAVLLSEDYTIALVEQVPETIVATTVTDGPREDAAWRADLQRKLLQRAIFLAAHYDRPLLVQKLFQSFSSHLAIQPDEDRFAAVNVVARECLRSFRKLGLRDDINGFLTKLSEQVVRGRSVARIRGESGRNWLDMLSSLLALAEGWSVFGGYEQAKPFLDEARAAILANGPAEKVKDYLGLTRLVRAYISSLSFSPAMEAAIRIDEVFQQLGRLPNTAGPSQYYSMLHLGIVEELVRSLVGDNVALGDQARRWLDDDEYLVRRRIHGDMKRLLAVHGL